MTFLSFPDVVDERAARTVATGVVALTILAIVTRSPIVVETDWSSSGRSSAMLRGYGGDLARPNA